MQAFYSNHMCFQNPYASLKERRFFKNSVNNILNIKLLRYMKELLRFVFKKLPFILYFASNTKKLLSAYRIGTGIEILSPIISE